MLKSIGSRVYGREFIVKEVRFKIENLGFREKGL
jgi:hypothetical protein